MRNKGLCTESIRAIQRYFALLPFHQRVHAHQSGLQPKFSGLCTRTVQSHLAVFSINRNTIGCFDFVSIRLIQSQTSSADSVAEVQNQKLQNQYYLQILTSDDLSKVGNFRHIPIKYLTIFFILTKINLGCNT